MGVRQKHTRKISLALCFFGLLTGKVIAANVSPAGLTVMPGFGALEWNIENDGSSNATAFTGFCKSLPGLTIDDATSANGDTNAFDTAYTIYVNGTPFVAPNPSDLTGTTFTAGPVSMSGLNVTVEYHFSDTIQAARVRVILQNPTAVNNNPSINIALNLGSDAGTVIEATSSGDLLYTAADRWVITSDGLPFIPVNTTVVYGPGAVREVPFFTTTTVCGAPEPTGIGYTFNIAVPANATRQLMFFAGLGDIVGPGNTITGAIANVTMFNGNNSIDPSLLAGIPGGDLGEILNWAFTAFIGLGGGGGGGGGGGCTLSTRYVFDPTLWLYVLISAVYLRRRRRKRMSPIICLQ